jgi:cytochrome o ubiquinol oxidase subunit II
MKKFAFIIAGIAAAFALIALAIFYISPEDIVVLDSKGLIGKKERELIITASLLMLIVVIPVFIFAWFFSWRYSVKRGKGKHTPDWEHNSIAECCWWGVPLIIIVILAVLTWKSTHELNPFKPILTDQRPVKVQVVALQWKWLFIYPEYGVATINYLQFPDNTPIDFELTSDAPMNAFWIPQLGGMIYAMPAKRSQLHLVAEERGKYRGLSAHISGSGFAGMTFDAVATSNEEFESWINDVKGSSSSLNFADYEELVKPSSYVPVQTFVVSDNLFEKILAKYQPKENYAR